jgi:hypothetical protein
VLTRRGAAVALMSDGYERHARRVRCVRDGGLGDWAKLLVGSFQAIHVRKVRAAEVDA